MHTGILTRGELTDIFRGANKDPEKRAIVYRMNLGGPVAYALERGGRLIGVYPDENSDSMNALWVNPNLQRVLIEGGDWNLGGDRLWQGPEFSPEECDKVTFFCQEPGNYGKWVCQPAIDTGNYAGMKMSAVKGAVSFQSTGEVEEFQKGGRHNVTLYRYFDPTKKIEPPNKGVTCANIDFIDSVGSSAPFFYAWKLVQVNAGDSETPGSVIYPANENPVIGVYMNEHGLGLNDFVKIGDDHVSIRTESLMKRYKLSMTPGSFRKTGGGQAPEQHTVMHISKVPGSEDRYQLVAVHSRSCPTDIKDIFEVSSAKQADLQGLPSHFSTERGASYAYNGPTPAEDSCFTELEFAGKGARANEKSGIVGSLTFCWGSGEAIMDAAKKLAGTGDYPFVFGLND